VGAIQQGSRNQPGVPMVTRILRNLWSAPYGIPSILLGILALFFFPQSYYMGVYGVRVIVVKGPLADWLYFRGWGAVTIGWVVFVWTDNEDALNDSVIKHEARHVQQVRWLGVFFLPVYFALWMGYALKDFWVTYPFRDVVTLYRMGASMWHIASGCLKEGYRNSPLERDARRHE
jgi:hypothetical protein